MSYIGAAIGAAAGIAWGVRAVWSMRQRNLEAQRADSAEIERILGGKPADEKWLDEVRSDARHGIVSPTTVEAISEEAGFSEQDVEDARKSWTFWGGDEKGAHQTGSSDIMLGVTFAATCVSGALGGLVGVPAAGAWAAGLAAVSCGDFRWRRIDPVDLLVITGLGLASAPSLSAVAAQGVTAAVTAGALYALSVIGRAVSGKDVFGLGDVLLIASIAAAAPFIPGRLELALGALVIENAIVLAALKLSKSDTAIPFAPLLFLPALLYGFGA